MVQKLRQFVVDVQSEMGKVTWPTRDELTTSTAIVLIVSAALALFIFVVDFLLSRIMDVVLI